MSYRHFMPVLIRKDRATLLNQLEFISSTVEVKNVIFTSFRWGSSLDNILKKDIISSTIFGLYGLRFSDEV